MGCKQVVDVSFPGLGIVVLRRDPEGLGAAPRRDPERGFARIQWLGAKPSIEWLPELRLDQASQPTPFAVPADAKAAARRLDLHKDAWCLFRVVPLSRRDPLRTREPAKIPGRHRLFYVARGDSAGGAARFGQLRFGPGGRLDLASWTGDLSEASHFETLAAAAYFCSPGDLASVLVLDMPVGAASRA